MARPTKYSQQILELAQKYIDSYEALGDPIPSIEGLADFLNVARDTIYDWSSDQDKGEFSDIVERVRSRQGRTLINGGLKGTFNPTITKLLLHKHGYTSDNRHDVNAEIKPRVIVLSEVLAEKNGIKTEPVINHSK